MGNYCDISALSEESCFSAASSLRTSPVSHAQVRRPYELLAAAEALFQAYELRPELFHGLPASSPRNPGPRICVASAAIYPANSQQIKKVQS